jgi:hypothetical protein
MNAAVGFLTAAVQLGVDQITVKPKRNIGTFTAQVTIEEVHTDELEVVDHPVEIGAPVTDHSFLRPAELVVTVGWSNSPGSSNLFGSLASAVTGTIAGISSIASGNAVSQVKDIYDKFLTLQRTRTPFEVNTGKRLYTNMLIRSMHTSTAKDTENSLIVKVTMRQVLIVTTKVLTISAPPEAQKDPSATSPTSDEGTKQLGPAPSFSSTQGDSAINPQLRH